MDNLRTQPAQRSGNRIVFALSVFMLILLYSIVVLWSPLPGPKRTVDSTNQISGAGTTASNSGSLGVAGASSVSRAGSSSNPDSLQGSRPPKPPGGTVPSTDNPSLTSGSGSSGVAASTAGNPGSPSGLGSTTTGGGTPTGGTKSQGPVAEDAGGDYNWFGLPIHFATDTHVLLLVLLAGALGGSLQTILAATVHLGTKDFDTAWNSYYLARPLQGATVAAISFLILKAGLMPTTPVGLAQAGPIAIAALVGLYSREFLAMLLKIFGTLFSPAPPSTKTSSTPALTMTFDPQPLQAPRNAGAGPVRSTLKVVWPSGSTTPVVLATGGPAKDACRLEPNSLQPLTDGTNTCAVEVSGAGLPSPTSVTISADSADKSLHGEAVLQLP